VLDILYSVPENVENYRKCRIFITVKRKSALKFCILSSENGCFKVYCFEDIKMWIFDVLTEKTGHFCWTKRLLKHALFIDSFSTFYKSWFRHENSDFRKNYTENDVKYFGCFSGFDIFEGPKIRVLGILDLLGFRSGKLAVFSVFKCNAILIRFFAFLFPFFDP